MGILIRKIKLINFFRFKKMGPKKIDFFTFHFFKQKKKMVEEFYIGRSWIWVIELSQKLDRVKRDENCKIQQ